MEFKAGRVIAIVLAGILCVASASSDAEDQAPVVRYPTALHGVWLGEGAEYCKHPDSLDSDSRFVIAATKLTGYEDWQKPVSVRQISKAPQAWRVVSIQYRDGYTFDIVDIMVLRNKGSVLTIVSDEHSRSYFRCP